MSTDDYIINGHTPYVPISDLSVGQIMYDVLKNRKRFSDASIIDVAMNERVTYDDLIKKTTRLAHSLRKCGYDKNSIFSICSENNVFYFYPVIAALYIGAITAPINPNYKDDELMHALNISKPAVIFCSKNCVEKILSIKRNTDFVQLIIVINAKTDSTINGTETLDAFIEKHTDDSFNPFSFRPEVLQIQDHVAFIMCSSGTTGLPKGVMITHRNINVRITQIKDPLITKIRDEDTYLSIVPFFHIYGCIVALGYIIEGHKIVLMPKFDEHLYLKAIQDFKVKTLMIVPPVVTLLAKSPLLDNYDLSSVDEIISGAAPLSEQLEKACIGRFKNIENIRQVYGMTETTAAITMVPTNEFKPGSSGKAVSYLSIKILDTATGKTLGPNQTGEICMKRPMIMKGYYQNEAETKKIIDNDGWLHSGDLGYFDEDGFLFVVDRLKELIKYKGYQVPPAELEALLLKHPKIKDVGVVGLPNEEAGELPFAFVVKVPGNDITENEVQEYVAENVAPYKKLRGGVHFVEAIPKNPSGKILRRELRAQLQELISRKQ